MFLITAVTLYKVLLLSLVSMILPITSLLPKYFWAVASVITTVFGSFSAVWVLPVTAGRSNRLKKVESACATFFFGNELRSLFDQFTAAGIVYPCIIFYFREIF